MASSQGVTYLDSCLLLWKVQNGVSGGGFSSGQSWPSMPPSFIMVLTVVEGIAHLSPRGEGSHLDFCWLSLVQPAASKMSEPEQGRPLM